jgi:hypothetical protein
MQEAGVSILIQYNLESAVGRRLYQLLRKAFERNKGVVCMFDILKDI